MARPKKYRIVSFTIPAELDDKLEILKTRLGISKAELIRFFIISGLYDLKESLDELEKFIDGQNS